MISPAKNQLLDQSLDGYLIVHNNRITECNPSGIALLGCRSANEIRGKELIDFSTSHQPDGLQSKHAWGFYADEAQKNGTSRFDWTCAGQQGEVRWVEVMISTLDHNSGRYLVSLRDINDRKLQEEKTNLRSARMIIQNQILSELTRIDQPESDLDEYFEIFTRVIGQYPDIDRTCVWVFKSKNQVLAQKSIYQTSSSKRGRKVKITNSECPRFFTQAGQPIVAHNAITDYRTNEFNDTYLQPFDIKSIIFAPVILGKKLYGGVTLERVGRLRKWEIEEQSFAVTIVEIIAKHIEQKLRQATELKLKHSQKRLSSLIENASDAIAISDINVNFFYVSPAVEAFLGYTPEEFTRLNGAKLVHPKHRIISRPIFDECLQNPGKAISTEFLFRRKDGKYVYLEITFYNLLHDEAVKGVVMNFRDITERKRSERNLIKVNDELKTSQIRLQQKVEEQEKTLRLFKKYVPEEVVQKAIEMSEDSILEGEIRAVVVLFCDIRGFTPMSEEMEPKEVVSFLNDYYSVMTDIVKRYHGTVMQFVGDEIFATFGAPVDHPDNEVNAVMVAIEMLSKVDYLTSRASRPIEIGIGINSGEVVAGNLGSEDRIGYSVSGDTVNTGKRIETLTKDKSNTILISPSVYEKTKQLIRAKRWKPVQVKGKQQKVVVYEVQGLNRKSSSMNSIPS